MNIILSAKNFTLTEANKEYARKKFAVLERHDSSIRILRAELDADKKERDNMKFRVEVWIEGNHVAKAGSHGITMNSAIDDAVKKLKRQLAKRKEKIVSNKKKATT